MNCVMNERVLLPARAPPKSIEASARRRHTRRSRGRSSGRTASYRARPCPRSPGPSPCGGRSRPTAARRFLRKTGDGRGAVARRAARLLRARGEAPTLKSTRGRDRGVHALLHLPCFSHARASRPVRCCCTSKLHGVHLGYAHSARRGHFTSCVMGSVAPS